MQKESGLVPATVPEIVGIDHGKIDRAVQHINEKTILNGLKLAQEVGEYVLEIFFDGDFDKFQDSRRNKDVSFRALLDRKDLLIAGSAVYYFVRVSQELRLLPEDLAMRLSFSQHRALLPLKDTQSKRALAQRAVEEGWTTRTLSAEVSKLLPKSRSGRKPLPPLVKGIRQVSRALDEAVGADATPETMAGLVPERSAELTQQIDAIVERLKAVWEVIDLAESENGGEG